MERNKAILLFLFTFLVLPPLMNSNEANLDIRQNLKAQNTDDYSDNNSSHTNFNISYASIVFEIQEVGTYSCFFDLIIFGNSQTRIEGGKGRVIIQDKEISSFQIFLSDVPISSTRLVEGNSSVCDFNLTQNLDETKPAQLSGNFQGKIKQNNSGIYKFELGVNWGTVVSAYNTTVHIGSEVGSIITPVEPSPYKVTHQGNSVDYYWWGQYITEFSLKLDILSNEINTLVSSLSSWEPFLHQSIEVQIQNPSPIEIHARVITPSWIDCNVTDFWLPSNQSQALLFIVNSEVNQNSSGTIFIVSIFSLTDNEYIFRDLIEISVNISPNSYPSSENGFQSFLLPFLIIFSLGLGIILSGFVYQQRETLYATLMNKISPNSVHIDNSDSLIVTGNSWISNENVNRNIWEGMKDWESIHSKWKGVLSERELEILEILYIQGSSNQQAIATRLDLSKSTISRIISQLEAKRFITRERLGISNIVKFNRERE
jgi:hypothetical protein